MYRYLSMSIHKKSRGFRERRPRILWASAAIGIVLCWSVSIFCAHVFIGDRVIEADYLSKLPPGQRSVAARWQDLPPHAVLFTHCTVGSKYSQITIDPYYAYHEKPVDIVICHLGAPLESVRIMVEKPACLQDRREPEESHVGKLVPYIVRTDHADSV